MDLASFFAETAAAAEGNRDPVFPAVPVLGKPSGNDQTVVNKSISRNSRISRGQNADIGFSGSDAPPARAGGRERAGARGPIADRREQREQREKPAGSDTCISRSLSQKREIERETGNPGIHSAGLADPDAIQERAAFLEYDGGLSRADAEAMAAAEIVGAPVAPAGLGWRQWHAALTALPAGRIPCPGYAQDGWASTRARALAFLNAFGEQAEALGWDALRLFSVHPQIGILRVDHCGGLVIPLGGPVRAITATTISFGHMTHRQKLGQPQGVLIWNFGQ